MCNENQPVDVEKSSLGNSIKKEVNVDDEDEKLFFDQGWPEWLPHDWYIHRDLADDGADSKVYYSNPKGKRFYSKEDVLGHVSKHVVSRKKMRRSRRNAVTKKDVSEENKLPNEDTTPFPLDSSSEWPDWLPQDWSIERSCDNPCDLYYCSPKWKKFQSKDEVLNYITAKSKKLKPKQIRCKRKNSWANDEACVGPQRRRQEVQEQ